MPFPVDARISARYKMIMTAAAKNAMTYTITASRPVFLPASLEVVSLDREVADLLDEGGAKGFACSFWAVLDRSRGGLKVCQVEIGEGVAHLLVETARELFADDVSPKFKASLA